MLKLILPVIFPSWRFFSSIGPSPRIQFSFLANEFEEPHAWQEFRPRPEKITFTEGLRHLFWNPQWNETLYMNTCAERLFDEYSLMREQEIMRRILAAIASGEIIPDENATFLVYRINAVIREGNEISNSVVFVSKPAALKGRVL